MTMETKNNIFLEHLKTWLAAAGDKKKRGEIVNNICFVAGIHPKSVPRSFKRIQLQDPAHEEQRGRKTYYTPDVIAALKQVWEIGSESCGENLHPLIAEYVECAKQDMRWTHDEIATTKLLKMSCATVKRRTANFKRKYFLLHGKSTTQRGTIHALIPIRIGPWSTAPIGTMQIDTVAHCGSSIAGAFIYTVNSTDVATLWGARRAQWNKGQEATVGSMKKIAEEILFPVVEWHPDSGSEFINWHCKDWCMERGELLTRSRPNHSNDNCFVEERNGHTIRRWIGYARLDAPEVVTALNLVYDMLTPYCNHFVASKRTVSKERIGARWKVKREPRAKTPYQRVLERDDVSNEIKLQLQLEHELLNPLVLKREIDLRLKKVFNLQKHYGNTKMS